MRRYQLFEWEDAAWFPQTLRSCITEFLCFMIETLDLYAPVTPLLAELLAKTGGNRIVDLCSGAGGPMLSLKPSLDRALGREVGVTLTDKFPNLTAFAALKAREPGIDYYSGPVDATRVPAHLVGARTLFSAFHHFPPPLAQAILASAVEARVPIAVFECGERSVFLQAKFVLAGALGSLLTAPFVRPFRWTRLFYTYVVPIVPFCVAWDGLVSGLRFYTPAELLALAPPSADGRYVWKAGKVTTCRGDPVTYLIGHHPEAR
jgi:hypothetical protein